MAVSKSELKRKYAKLARKESKLVIRSISSTGQQFKDSEKSRSKINKELNRLHKKIQSKQSKRKGYY